MQKRLTKRKTSRILKSRKVKDNDFPDTAAILRREGMVKDMEMNNWTQKAAQALNAAHAALMSSHGHRRNILAKNFNNVGIAVFQDAYGFVTVVEVFAKL